MKTPPIPKSILNKAKQIVGKRSRVVVDHILKHGHITTEDLENYGYKHPPRAIRDVREQGLPLERFWTHNKGGRKIAGYRFGKPSEIRNDRLGGRTVFSDDFRNRLIQTHKSKCAICSAGFENRYFQVDHRIPYELAGDVSPDERVLDDYLPLCGSCNRAKSWSCEHCPNWLKQKDDLICETCYWASPTQYTHVATMEIRRLDVVWEQDEVKDYNLLFETAKKHNRPLPIFVKMVLQHGLVKNNP